MSSSELVKFAISPHDFFDSAWQLNFHNSRRSDRKKPLYHYEKEEKKPEVQVEDPLLSDPVQYFYIEEEEDDEGFALFIVSEVLFGFIGFYLAGAVRNWNWDSKRWDWESEVTSTATSKGGLDGATTPYAFFYSAEVIGIELTVLLAIFGAYLGISAENNSWDPGDWDLISPRSYEGAFEGLQDCVWLIDDISEIQVFMEKAQMREWEQFVFIVISYAIGGVVSYYYIAHDNGGNYRFWEWDYKSPVTLFGIVKGYHEGTRLPVGFGEIGLEVIQAIERSEGAYDEERAFFYNFVIRNRWMWAGGIWVGVIYASVENEAFDFGKWDWGSIKTLEGFLNGFMFGKDLEEMFVDVRRYFLGNSGTETGYI